jgi:membrane protein YqaA with SNARE-associated domain
MLSAPASESSLIPNLLGAGTIVGGFVGYVLGYVHAVWRRARKDYVTTKDSVPGLRSTKWAAWRAMVQRGVLAGAVLTCLIAWVITSAT